MNFHHFFKRILDVFMATFVLVFLSLVMILIAVAIKVEDNGPVLYFQERMGKNCRKFRLVKFRSMVVDAHEKGLKIEVAKDDDRITKVGKFLRITSLDELPQFYNILVGQMSVVGPRPTVPSQVELYNHQQLDRLSVLPGLTGWAQVNGRNSISWEKRIDLDIWYVRNWSLWLDLLIVARTPYSMLPIADSHYGQGGIVEEFKGNSK